MKRYDQQELASILADGGVILCPTDTIRGLSSDATNESAVERVYEIKQRPKEKSMIVLMASEEMLASYGVQLTDLQRDFLSHAKKPTTIILDGVQGLAPSVYHTDGSVGIRIVYDHQNNPGAHWCYEFLSHYGKPIVSTSANLSGETSPKLFHEISQQVVDMIDGYSEPDISKEPGEASQVVRIENDGSVSILRP